MSVLGRSPPLFDPLAEVLPETTVALGYEFFVVDFCEEI